ncbi:ABC transporter [Enterococcus camelliae]|uniref:ABC transporter n=1 Tax=Enterococcus camelliae TaxID=453959 RepID=A0ABW5TLM5_9ENTE
MISSQLKALMNVNLLFINPQVTERARKKGKQGKQLTRYIVQQYLLSMVVFLGIYGLSMLSIDFSKNVGFFTFYMGLFSILALSQGISTVYNVFFESQDLAGYLPLPFRQREIFLAKMLIVALSIVPFILPLLLMYFLTSWRSGVNVLLAVVLAIISFSLFLMLTFELCSFLVFGLTKTKVFKKHKKLMTSLLLILSTLIAVLGILFMSQQSSSTMTENQVDRTVISGLLPFYWMVSTPFQLNGLLSWGGFLGIIVLGVWLIKQLILPKLYEQLLDASPGITHEKRKQKVNQSFIQMLVNYNFQLMKDPNLLMQVVTNSLLMPLIFIISFGISGGVSAAQLDAKFAIVFLLVGIFLAYLIATPSSFIALIISLDKLNFLYVNALPINRKMYLKVKFWMGVGVQVMLFLIASIVAYFLFHIPLSLLASMLVGGIISSYVFSEYYFWRDFRLMDLYWTNVNQLVTRGSGTTGMILKMFGGLIGGGILIGLATFGVLVFSAFITTIILLLLVILLTVMAFVFYQRKYWQAFA